MDIFFADPTAIPLPPEQVRIVALQAEPWPDGRRVHVTLEVTPFLKRPNAELRMTDQDGDVAASISVIETITPKMEFTMHLRSPQLQGEFTLSARLYYRTSALKGEEPVPAEAGEEMDPQVDVDHSEITFAIPAQPA